MYIFLTYYIDLVQLMYDHKTFEMNLTKVKKNHAQLKIVIFNFFEPVT